MVWIRCSDYVEITPTARRRLLNATLQPGFTTTKWHSPPPSVWNNGHRLTMAKVVRQSKFRHVYGKPKKREECYDDVKVTANSHDSVFCSINPKFLAVVTESGGGGMFIVVPMAKVRRRDIACLSIWYWSTFNQTRLVFVVHVLCVLDIPQSWSLLEIHVGTLGFRIKIVRWTWWKHSECSEVDLFITSLGSKGQILRIITSCL